MTDENQSSQGPAAGMCGMSERMPADLQQMMQRMLQVCGRGMQGASASEGGHAAEDENGQQPQNMNQSMDGCGCAPMMERMLSKRRGAGTR